MPSPADLLTRYGEFLEKAEATLPAGLEPLERATRLKAALDDLMAKDTNELAETAEQELAHLYDSFLIKSEHDPEHHDALAKARESLAG